MTSDIRPGLLVLHGNRLESLRDVVSEFLARHPLEPLEEEALLVQSNGAAEWLKMSLASLNGICASSRVELPARFLWRAYRQVLGPGAVPSSSPLEKSPLTWRLMRLLASRLQAPAFAPIAGFLQGNDLERRLQLAERLADLYDQYQVYRADWLEAWGQGLDVLRSPSGVNRPLPPDQRWQAALWRELLSELSDDERHATRAQVHRDFLAALAKGAAPHSPLPRRVVLFGASHIPGQTLEALAALSRQVQVLLAIPNPCRFHWADILEGRELMRPGRRRQALRDGRDLAAVSLESMHAHAHPLLAAWGRQGRDFMRQLDAFDDAERSKRQFDVPRIDLFDDGAGATLLAQVQATIRDLVPLAEHPVRRTAPGDRSIVFHVAHSPQREVEVLHDQLLALFASTAADAPLKPRDVVVMVPDIEVFAPAIRAVFGQHAHGDPRRIPFGIVDISSRGNDPLLVALEWLLRAPAQRFRFSEVKDLLEVPAIARRFGLEEDDVPTLARWIEGAGVRWGLDEAQRAGIGLEACGEQNSWAFGLRRMLLGYASGAPFAGIEPYDEVGGLDASLVGALADLVERLGTWCVESQRDATAREWARRGRALLAALVEPFDEGERLALAAVESALAGWLEACELAGFDEPVSLTVFREAWLAAVDPPGGARRFLSGGVTFCTLMPLRAVPFEVVCLLGMNDGAYPRQGRRSDFDLMGLPGQQRPGDRSRRDDDRYLMLEALLSARRVLYVSWSGRSARDDSEQPPSVLVSQLRQYLSEAWAGDGEEGAVAERTTEHPLQPFSSRYFEGRKLFTYAREWRAAHGPARVADVSAAVPSSHGPGAALTMARLASFLKKPARAFFRERLGVSFDEQDEAADDDEAFAVKGLDRWIVLDELIAESPASGVASRSGSVAQRLQRIEGAGRLPLGGTGARLATELQALAEPMVAERRRIERALPRAAPPRRLRFEGEGVVVDDWLDGLRSDGSATAWLIVRPSTLVKDSKGKPPLADKLIDAWVRMLVASACDAATPGWLVGCDETLRLGTIDGALARETLRRVLEVWRQGMREPLPLPSKTALAFVSGTDARPVYEGSPKMEGERREPCMARCFPDHAALIADGRFAQLAAQVYEPMLRWIDAAVAIEPRGHATTEPEPAGA